MSIELYETDPNLQAEKPLINAFIVSEKGGGKTTLCAGFPNPLILDYDDGINAVGDVPGLVYIPNRLLNYEVVLEIAMAITQRTPEGNITLRLLDGKKFIERQLRVDTLVFDSITKGHPMFLRSAMALGGRKTPAIQDWGLAMERVITIIDMVKPYVNVLVTGHFEIIRDPNLERVLAQVRLPGQVGEHLSITLSEFWRIKQDIDVQKRRRVSLWTVNDGIYPASTRFARRGMPPFIDITDDPPGSRDFYKTIISSIGPPIKRITGQ